MPEQTIPPLPDSIRERLRKYGEAQFLQGHHAAGSTIRAILRIEVDGNAEANESLVDSHRSTKALEDVTAEIRKCLR